MKGWIHVKRKDNLINKIDSKKVVDFIDSSNKLTYRVKSIKFDKYSPCVKPDTVKRAIRNGHEDIELWLHVNPVTKESYKDSYGFWRTRYSGNGKTQSWVLDLDNIEGVSNIGELRTTMAVRNVPIPYMIVQTSPNSFHCAYHGLMGDWPEKKRKWVIEKWCGCELNEHNMNDTCKENGVDLFYFNLSFTNHAIRVPGSINTNYKKDGKYWECISWKNDKYTSECTDYIDEKTKPQRVNIPDPNVVALPVPKFVPRFDIFVEPVTQLLEELIPKGFVHIKLDSLARLVANNAIFLAKGQCRIHQVTWAKKLECSQYDISRLVNRLTKLGILEKVDDSYKPGSYSKTYKAGEMLKRAIGETGRQIQPPDWVRWDDGTSHERLLYDVRYFCSQGLDDIDVLRKLNERQANRPSRKQRPNKELIQCVGKYRTYMRSSRTVSVKRDEVMTL